MGVARLEPLHEKGLLLRWLSQMRLVVNVARSQSVTFTAPSPETEAKYNYSYDVSAWGQDGPAQASYPDWQAPDLCKHTEL